VGQHLEGDHRGSEEPTCGDEPELDPDSLQFRRRHAYEDETDREQEDDGIGRE